MTNRLPFDEFMPAIERVVVSKNLELRFEVYRDKRMKYVAIGLWRQMPEKYWIKLAGDINIPINAINEIIQVLMNISQSYASKPFSSTCPEVPSAIREARSNPNCP
jgi:N-glycosylase/DNA lyase